MKIPAKGKTERAALAGQIIGGYKAAAEAAERAERQQRYLQTLAAQKEMAVFNQQLLLDRAKFNAAMDLEEEKRARTWSLEKMELRSRMDFAEDERKRLQREREMDNAIKQLYENPIYAKLSPEQKQRARMVLEMRKYTTASMPFGAERANVPSQGEYVMLQQGGYSPEQIKELYGLPEPAESTGMLASPETPTGGGYTGTWEPESLKANTAGGQQPEVPTITNDADYDALPSGTVFIDPQGNLRTKP